MSAVGLHSMPGVPVKNHGLIAQLLVNVLRTVQTTPAFLQVQSTTTVKAC